MPSFASRSSSLLEQLPRASSSSRDESPSSNNAREDDFRHALDTAIGSLHALVSLYRRREMRWIEEKFRLGEDKERVQLLLKQVLGAGVVGNWSTRRVHTIDSYFLRFFV